MKSFTSRNQCSRIAAGEYFHSLAQRAKNLQRHSKINNTNKGKFHEQSIMLRYLQQYFDQMFERPRMGTRPLLCKLISESCTPQPIGTLPPQSRQGTELRINPIFFFIQLLKPSQLIDCLCRLTGTPFLSEPPGACPAIFQRKSSVSFVHATLS